LYQEDFWRALRGALRNLYDPAALRQNPLNSLLTTQPDRAQSLQDLLLDAVQALRPARGTSVQSDAHRTYQILLHRYVETFSQNEVAMSLGLSARQLRRHEQLAIRSLGEYLRTRYALPIAAPVQDHDSAVVAAGGDDAADRAADNTGEAYQDDLEWLHQATPPEFVDVNELITGALGTLEPFFQELKLSVQRLAPPELPCVAANAMALRQALMITLTSLARRAAGKQLSILPAADDRELRIAIQQAGTGQAISLEEDENLIMVQRLMALSGGALVTQSQDEDSGKLLAPASVVLALPLLQPVTILIIDDNQDALQLVQRYLAGTHYHPVVARSPLEGLAMAQQVMPQVILLDVMLPGMDGWETLARLRRHPATEMIPVIICTILPEELLARSLGASAFLRKPLARDELLYALQAVATQPPAAM
jgi:CheY-like chemotaxis protein